MGKSQSQGQRGLFPEAPYMAPDRRYPRGYTPERMAGVKKALTRGRSVETGELIPGTTTSKLRGFTESAVQAPSADMLQRQGKMPGAVAAVQNKHVRAVHEALARSRVPTLALRSIDKIAPEPLRLRQLGAGGEYSPRERKIAVPDMESGDKRGGGFVGMPKWKKDRGIPSREKQDRRAQTQQRLATQRDKDDTLIHEVGHHVDFSDRRRNAERGSTLAAVTDERGLKILPKEEAFADDFMVNHAKQDPRDRLRSGARVPRTYLNSGTLAGEAAKPYIAARTTWADASEARLARGEEFSAGARHGRAEQEELPGMPSANSLYRAKKRR